ncbi:MAG: hypothetical protein GWN84_02325 [Gammaproteobacteria bacterium]|nr:hypothetical protein [Gammaproteobacteria bacterium]NIR89039.1 hypothetical protein [Gammaproteobacteria bacterium]NIV74186.1 hypothetical protein [Gammaproteobacteria bacterium]NIW85335.1 hypothetical protein [Gammaproteobacteria bacterium]
MRQQEWERYRRQVEHTLSSAGRDRKAGDRPARYPDAYDAGAPMDYYAAPDSEEAIRCAARILRWLDDRAAAQSS